MTRIISCEQGTAEWLSVRAGMPTASEFATVMAQGKSGAESKTRRSYMLKLAGEILTGEPMESYSNQHMDRGKAMEAEARDLYSLLTDAEPEQVGFVVNDEHRCGCSPDSLIGDCGALEIKSALAHILIDKLLRDDFPPEHKAQCQGVLWVADREWIDLAVYTPKLPLFIRRAYRDDAYIAGMAKAVAAFNAELDETVERIRRFGAPARSEAA